MLSNDKFPPRGFGPRTREDTPPDEGWQNPKELPLKFPYNDPSAIVLGHWNNQYIAIKDDRHLLTLAGSRAGKTRTVLIPNLLNYRGPCVVIDVKGELAKATAEKRKEFGPVHVLDPFKELRGLFPIAGHNVFSELARSNFHAADAALIAEALIVDNEKDPHWTDAAKNLLTGIILLLVRTKGHRATLSDVRKIAQLPGPELLDRFIEMIAYQDEDATLANTGALFRSYAQHDDGQFVGWSKEMLSILSTAQNQTSRLDELASVTDQSSFRLSDIGPQNLTIYLVLPATRMASHARWLRLFIMQALAAMERHPIPREKDPALFVLEEFPTLGHVGAIETSAGYIAGFGVKLWTVLQDLTQLQRHYPKTWETFLGNAGVIQAFGNFDPTTTKVLSEFLGQTRYVHVTRNPASAASMQHGDLGLREDLKESPLLSPGEIARYFARETGRQMLLMPGEQAIYCHRLTTQAS